MKTKQTNQRQIMQAHVDACNASGLKVEKYCQLHNLKIANYYYWRRRLQENHQGMFTKITLPSPQRGSSSLLFSNGHQLFFDNLPPVDYVKQLIG
jgi:hypothetical protein